MPARARTRFSGAPPSVMPLPAHHRLGRFEIVSTLGTGGMGEVYRARDTTLGREVAIKVLAPHLASRPDALRRFEQEARTVAALADPNIITIFDVATDGPTPFLVTELLQGVTLRDRLLEGSLDWSSAVDLGIQITRGLAAAHAAGIVHRDIKPQNIFITRAGIVKLLDFGIARLSEPIARDVTDESGVQTLHATTEAVIVGTPAYMSPEQARGHALDRRTDVFACGCVLHEMLSGAGPFARPTSADSLAAVLETEPPPLPVDPSRPLIVDRVVSRCLAKDARDRFQSANDLQFVLESVRDPVLTPVGRTEPRRSRISPVWWLAGVAALTLGIGSLLISRRNEQASVRPSIRATVVVPASARPIAPAISPDGKWVAYVGLGDGRPDLFAQFINGGAPVNLTLEADMPVQNRTIVGGIDVLPDGSGIAVAGRPRSVGLFQVPGIWVIPAPAGGPARRVTDRYASLRWSPDGKRIAGVIANPLLGDAIAVANADGQDERILVPLQDGLHLHQVAWGHDGRYIYYTRTLEVNHALGDIYRVSVDGGEPEAVITTAGTAMYPAPTPDGRALVYAANHSGEGLNIWWRPLDGSPEWRVTNGAGEYTEPYLARAGRHLVCLARRRKGGLIRIPIDPAARAEVVGVAGSGDGEPSVSAASNRIFISSARSGHRRIWSMDLAGQRAVPLTSGSDDDRRPAVSPDGRQLAFISNRGGRRGIWLAAAEGGTPRLLVNANVVDSVSWSPDNRRLVYAAPEGGEMKLWIIGTEGGPPGVISRATGRAPGWSPRGDAIVVVRAAGEVAHLHFTSASGEVVREPIAIGPVSLPTALAWSPDGTHIGMVNLPGRAAAEVWLLRVSDGHLRKLTEFVAPVELEGVAWTPDGKALLVGRTEYETEVVLIEGLP